MNKTLKLTIKIIKIILFVTLFRIFQLSIENSTIPHKYNPSKNKINRYKIPDFLSFLGK
jgi:hypothetical protein